MNVEGAVQKRGPGSTRFIFACFFFSLPCRAYPQVDREARHHRLAWARTTGQHLLGTLLPFPVENNEKLAFYSGHAIQRDLT